MSTPTEALEPWEVAFRTAKLRLLTSIETEMIKQEARETGRPFADIVRETYRAMYAKQAGDEALAEP